MTYPIYIVMGVSGTGKTTFSIELAKTLNYLYLDADDFHPQKNIDKMSQGSALNDEDRYPWLESLNKKLLDCLIQNQKVVLACSSLKKKYREILKKNCPCCFIYLHGNFELIYQRMKARKSHFMTEDMLKSQWETMESPSRDEIFIPISIDNTIQEMISLFKENFLIKK